MKNINIKMALMALTMLIVAEFTLANINPLRDELGASYYFTDHYEITINQPAKKVWPHLINLSSWIYEFDMIHKSGPTSSEGEVKAHMALA